MGGKAKSKALSIPVPGPGRKSLYREAYADQAFKLCLLGATDAEMASFFEVDERTINRWKIEHPAFCQSIRDGKIKADTEVAHSLYRSATGHQITAEKVVKVGDNYEAIRYKQYIPGDPNAAYKWLLNRRRQDWTDRQVHEHQGSVIHEHRAAALAEIEELFGAPTPHEIIIEAKHG
jgi:hypothetical protein